MKKLLSIIMLFICISTLSGCLNKKPIEASDTYMLMDTVCTIKVGGIDNTNVQKALAAAFDKAHEIAALTDYYSPSSEVSEINTSKANQPIFVSAETADLLNTALYFCEKSNGAFDITVAPLKDLWDIKNRKNPPADAELKALLPLVDYRKITIDKTTNTVTKSIENIKIDLGGCAKGYAADRALDILKQYDISYALIDFGGNILTYGKNPSRRDGKWLIGIQKPFSQNGESAKTVSVTDSAVVTSGTYQRFFEYNGKIYHHILDPKSGYPTDNGLSSVSIITSSALTADCLSTACMVVGEERGKELAAQFDAKVITLSAN